MKLIALNLRNFKGIQNFKLEPNGNNADVFGDNGLGKTTIKDAFCWLIDGKDSAGNAKFEIKTLKDNVAIPKLEHEVEGIFLHKGKTVALKKMYREVYKRKRGESAKTFSGHENNYWVNGVPAAQGEFDMEVMQLAGNKELFKVLTDPGYFPSLHWKNQRDMIINMIGDITDASVIASDKELEDLPSILGDNTAESHKKIIHARRREINELLESIPNRIDELSRQDDGEQAINKKKIEAEIESIRKQISGKELEILSIVNGEEVSKKEALIAAINLELKEIAGNLNQGVRDKVNASKDLLRDAEKTVNDVSSKIASVQAVIDRARNDRDGIKTQLDTLRAEYKDQSEAVFVDNGCPTCGKPLSSAEYEEAVEKFNINKASALEENVKKGMELKNHLDESELLINSSEEKIEVHKAEMQTAGDRRDTIQREIDELSSKEKGVEEDKSYQEKLSEKNRLESELRSLNTGTDELVAAVKAKRDELRQTVNSLEDKLATARVIERNQQRIVELSDQEKQLGAEYEKLERHLFLIDKFTRTKVSMLDDKINREFTIVTFRLFKEQVNGGLEDTCEVVKDGVPYNSLNDAGKIQAGLDIIKTFSRFHSFAPMIFIDRRESITSIPETDTQIINLIVSEADKKLRVEVR